MVFCNRATHNLWTLLEENRMIQKHIKDKTYVEWYKEHLHNSTYRPIIDRIVETWEKVRWRPIVKEHPLRTTVIGSYPFPSRLEYAAGHLDAFGPDDIAEMQGRRGRCRARRPSARRVGRGHRRRADAL